MNPYLAMTKGDNLDQSWHQGLISTNVCIVMGLKGSCYGELTRKVPKKMS